MAQAIMSAGHGAVKYQIADHFFIAELRRANQ